MAEATLDNADSGRIACSFCDAPISHGIPAEAVALILSAPDAYPTWCWSCGVARTPKSGVV